MGATAPSLMEMKYLNQDHLVGFENYKVTIMYIVRIISK